MRAVNRDVFGSDGTPPDDATRVIGDVTMRLRSVTPRTVSGRKMGRFRVVISSLSLLGVPMAGTENTTALSAITPCVPPAAGQDSEGT